MIERAWLLESKLRSLDALGTEPVDLPLSPLRIAALDPRAAVIGNRTVGAYLVAALTQLLRQLPVGQPWQHTICLFGAERLGGDLLDRLTDACETSRTGLVAGDRSIPVWYANGSGAATRPSPSCDSATATTPRRPVT